MVSRVGRCTRPTAQRVETFWVDRVTCVVSNRLYQQDRIAERSAIAALVAESPLPGQPLRRQDETPSPLTPAAPAMPVPRHAGDALVNRRVGTPLRGSRGSLRRRACLRNFLGGRLRRAQPAVLVHSQVTGLRTEREAGATSFIDTDMLTRISRNNIEIWSTQCTCAAVDGGEYGLGLTHTHGRLAGSWSPCGMRNIWPR